MASSNSRCARFAGLLIGVALLAGHALAATAPPQDEGLQEIVITARRQAENLQATPVSVTAFTAESLERRSVTGLPGIAAYTPDLRVSAGPQGGSSGHYFIRGIGQLDFIASTDPGVGVYLDGVYFGRTTGSAFDLLNVQRIEVLRGPQGTLFGRNTIGGAISVVAAAPPDDAAGSAALTAASRDHYEARVQLGGPLHDDLHADFALLARTTDGWQHRLLDARRFGDERTYAARSALRWEASERVQVLAALDATRSRGSADPHYLAGANAARGGRPDYVVSDPDVTWSGQYSADDLDVRGISITTSWQLDRTALKSVTAYRSLNSDTGIDFDGSPFADLDQLVLTRQSQRSQELQVQGGDSAGLHWLAGLYYFDEDIHQSIPITLYGTPVAQDNALRNQSSAAFSHLSYALSERLELSGGARYTYETKRHAFDDRIGDAQTPLFPPTSLHDRWRSFDPQIGLQIRATPELMSYLSVAQGFRSGGFNGRPIDTDEFLSYGPETLTTLELGLKSEWLSRRLRFNAAGFVSRYENIQLTRASIAASGAPIVVTENAGTARIHGFEVELTASPTARLLLLASAGNLHNEYTRLASGTAVQAQDRLPVSPHWTVNAASEYTLALGAASHLLGRVEYSYTSRYNYFFENPPLSWERAYAVWNLRLAFEPNAASWQVTAFVFNAGNERYSVFREDVQESYGVAIVWPARPREVGLELKYRF